MIPNPKVKNNSEKVDHELYPLFARHVPRRIPDREEEGGLSSVLTATVEPVSDFTQIASLRFNDLPR